MLKRARLGLGLSVFLFVAPAQALTILPTFTDGIETWSTVQKDVVNFAISQWENLILDDETVSVEFNFTNMGTSSYLGAWNVSGSGIPVGTDLYAWTPQLVHTIHFNADYFIGADTTWFDPTPGTNGDQPVDTWDALSIASHELGHMLGFAAGVYRDDFGGAGDYDKWGGLISGTTFDPGGLAIEMAGLGNLGHVSDSGTTIGDLMVPSTPLEIRRSISQTNMDMLALAYGYTFAPEPSTALLLGLGLMGLTLRRSRLIRFNG